MMGGMVRLGKDSRMESMVGGCVVHGFGIWAAIRYFWIRRVTDLMGDRQLLQYLVE